MSFNSLSYDDINHILSFIEDRNHLQILIDLFESKSIDTDMIKLFLSQSSNVFVTNGRELESVEKITSDSDFEARNTCLIVDSYELVFIGNVNSLSKFGSILFFSKVQFHKSSQFMELFQHNSFISNISFNECEIEEFVPVDLIFSPFLQSIKLCSTRNQFLSLAFDFTQMLTSIDMIPSIELTFDYPPAKNVKPFIAKLEPFLKSVTVIHQDAPRVYYDDEIVVKDMEALQSIQSDSFKYQRKVTINNYSTFVNTNSDNIISCYVVELKRVNEIDPRKTLSMYFKEIKDLFPFCESFIIPESMALIQFGNMEDFPITNMKEITIKYCEQTPIAIVANLKYLLSIALPVCEIKLRISKLSDKSILSSVAEDFGTEIIQQLNKIYYQIENEPILANYRPQLRVLFSQAINSKSISKIKTVINSIIPIEQSKDQQLELIREKVEIYNGVNQAFNESLLQTYFDVENCIQKADKALLQNDYSPQSQLYLTSRFNDLNESYQKLNYQVEVINGFSLDDLYSSYNNLEEFEYYQQDEEMIIEMDEDYYEDLDVFMSDITTEDQNIVDTY